MLISMTIGADVERVVPWENTHAMYCRISPKYLVMHKEDSWINLHYMRIVGGRWYFGMQQTNIGDVSGA